MRRHFPLGAYCSSSLIEDFNKQDFKEGTRSMQGKRKTKKRVVRLLEQYAPFGLLKPKVLKA